jgi:hypothetical protein
MQVTSQVFQRSQISTDGDTENGGLAQTTTPLNFGLLKCAYISAFPRPSCIASLFFSVATLQRAVERVLR